MQSMTKQNTYVPFSKEYKKNMLLMIVDNEAYNLSFPS